MAQSPYWKPKFHMTAFAQLASTLALFTGHIDQGGYVTLITLLIATFSTASVIENKNAGAQP